MNIKIKKHQLIINHYKLKCLIGKSGISSFKKEGDSKTPKGTFKIGVLYYRKDRIKVLNCKIKKKIINKNMGWCDDIKSNKYNKEIQLPSKFRAEELYRKDKLYDLCLEIKYNKSPIVKGKGSAIFLHLIKKNMKSTKGCIALSKTNFLKVLPLLKKKTKVSIS